MHIIGSIPGGKLCPGSGEDRSPHPDGSRRDQVITNVVGFDDGPFDRSRGGNVLLVGAVCARTRLDGVLSARVRRDGWNATATMAALVLGAQFARHIRAVLLGGIAVAGFNVVDIHGLAARLARPVLVVMRRPPRFEKIRTALGRLPGSDRRWALIEQAGPPEPVRGLLVQRAGLTLAQAEAMLAATTLHGKLPEPLRLAHLIAGGATTGVSRGRA
jgi:endonuclease V-like protein UPF0215 family